MVLIPAARPQGAIASGDGFEFRLWAPIRESVDLRIIEPQERIIPMQSDGAGNFSTHVQGLNPGALYTYLLDGETERPDPASRYQPDGVHGPSMTIDTGAFKWTDPAWVNPPLKDYIIYELHIGTFTPEGTFDAAMGRIPYLKELGVTAVEIMPVAQFPGSRNWGYDGVSPYSVQNSYGGPEGLMRLVDALHNAGLAAILDVVYNHLGPEGNYLRDFGPYFTDRYNTPWGDAINYDGAGCEGGREFFIGNALFWLEQYHFDALRLDAVHGIFDQSVPHILKEMKDRVMGLPNGGNKYLIAESDLNDTRLVDPPGDGGYGLDAQWCDDFHHALHTLITGERDGYYTDFGQSAQMAKALREGFVYSGGFSEFRKRKHGTSSAHVHPRRLVVSTQTHDQVGNRMTGDRLAATLGHDRLRLAAALMLLSPYIPLLFMGEEYAETAPFQYFVHHSDPALIEAVRRGRREEFASFAWKAEVPDPEAEETFMASKLHMQIKDMQPHKSMLRCYRELIRIRKTHPALMAPNRQDMDVVHTEQSNSLLIAMRGGGSTVFIAACLDPARAAEINIPSGGIWPEGGEWRRIFDTSDFGMSGSRPGMSGKIRKSVIIDPMSLSLFEHKN